MTVLRYARHTNAAVRDAAGLAAEEQPPLDVVGQQRGEELD